MHTGRIIKVYGGWPPAQVTVIGPHEIAGDASKLNPETKANEIAITSVSLRCRSILGDILWDKKDAGNGRKDLQQVNGKSFHLTVFEEQAPRAHKSAIRSPMFLLIQG